jgi:hypothetical protein
MRRNRTWLGVALAALALTFVVGTDSAQGAASSTPNLHTTVVALDRCSGELVTFDVTFHVLEQETTDGAGGTHLVLLAQGQRVRGVSESGVLYEAKSFGPYIEQTLANGSQVVTEVVVFHLVSHGAEDNRLLAPYAFHVTLTPEGTLTADVFHEFIECRG